MVWALLAQCPGAGGEVKARQTRAQSILRTEGSVCKCELT